MAYGNIYVARIDRVAVPNTFTGALIALTAAAGIPFEILRAKVTQDGSVTSEQIAARLQRYTTAPSIGTALTLLKVHEGDAANTVTALFYNGTTAITDGTLGDIIVSDGFNELSGWNEVPVPEVRVMVKAGSWISLRLPVAPGATRNISAEIMLRELGN